MAPAQAFCDALRARASVALWIASRGFGGKTFLLALLAAANAILFETDVIILGGSGQQSLRVVEHLHRLWAAGQAPVPTKNLIRTVCVTDRAVLGRRTITSVGMADVRSVEVDGRLASFGRSSGRRVSVHGLQAPAIRGCGQAACRW